MFFFGLAFLVILLGSIWLGLVSFAVALGYWNKAPIRYIALVLFGLSFLAALLFWTTDPNDTGSAHAWHGRYAIQGCSVGRPWEPGWAGPVMSLDEDQHCIIQDALHDTTMVEGSWNYMSTEDGEWIDLDLGDHGTMQLLGSPKLFRSNDPLPIQACR